MSHYLSLLTLVDIGAVLSRAAYRLKCVSSSANTKQNFFNNSLYSITHFYCMSVCLRREITPLFIGFICDIGPYK